MALLPDQKFSTFQDGGELEVDDIVVGLRDGINTKFTYTGELPPGVVVPIANGGTGATTAAGARTNLGLGPTDSPTFDNLTLNGGVIEGVNGNRVLTLLDQLNAVNSIRIFNNITGLSPALASIGDDTDVDFSIYTKGAGQIKLFSGSPTLPLSIFSGTGGAHETIFQMADTSATRTYIWPDASGTIALTSGTVLSLEGTANQVLVNGTSGTPVTGTDIILSTPQDIASISSPTFNNLTLDGGFINGVNNHRVLGLSDVASAVNYILITNSITGAGPTIGSVGSDTNVGMNFLTQLTGQYSFSTQSTIPFTIRSGTSYQRISTFVFSDTSAVYAYTYPDATGTLALTSDLTGFVTSVSGTANRITSTGGTTPVIDISASYVGQSSITTLGTIATGVWQGTLVGPTYGGTGVNNGASTITLGGSLSTIGAFTAAFTMTGNTAVTFPTSGTLATTASASGIVNSGTQNQLTWYAATGTTVSGLATANNGILVTSSGGVPSIGNSVGADLTINSVRVGRGNGAVSTNTCVGNSAMGAVATGGNNIAMGTSAMTSLTSGIRNVGLGFQALYSITTTNENVGVGFNALSGSASPASCTAVGTQALLNVSGSNNTGFGYNVGSGISSGSAQLTSGTNNTLLGFEADVNNAATIGALAIGSNAVADIATGATSADNGPGIAIGSAAFPVGFRGDGSIYPGVASGGGYWRQKINGTYYMVPMFADGSSGSIATVSSGTFAPNLQFGGANVGITYTAQVGRWQRVNNVITVSISIILSSKGSSAGNATISNLPVGAADNAQASSGLVLNDVTYPAGATLNYSPTTGGVLGMYSTVSGGIQTSLDDTMFTNTSQIFVVFDYFVA